MLVYTAMTCSASSTYTGPMVTVTNLPFFECRWVTRSPEIVPTTFSTAAIMLCSKSSLASPIALKMRGPGYSLTFVWGGYGVGLGFEVARKRVADNHPPVRRAASSGQATRLRQIRYCLPAPLFPHCLIALYKVCLFLSCCSVCVAQQPNCVPSNDNNKASAFEMTLSSADTPLVRDVIRCSSLESPASAAVQRNRVLRCTGEACCKRT